MTTPLHGDRRPVVTVIQSSPDVPLDRFGEWLGDVELRIVAAFAGESVPVAHEVGDGLVVLGGHMSTYDDATAPWLPELRALLADASTQGVPTLGICLGAQLLAVARGGRVQVSAPPGRESGVVDAGLCHGASGLALTFARLFQTTGEARLRDAGRRWFEQALALRRPGRGFAGFQSWQPVDDGAEGGEWSDDPSFLTGASGIGLALLAAATRIEPDWDIVLLLRPPPAGGDA